VLLHLLDDGSNNQTSAKIFIKFQFITTRNVLMHAQNISVYLCANVEIFVSCETMKQQFLAYKLTTR
jgi:hypothetical protein